MKTIAYFDLKKRIYYYSVLKKEVDISFWDHYKLEYIRYYCGILSDEFYWYLKKLLIQYNIKKLENYDSEWENDLIFYYLKNKNNYNY